jgi:cell division protein ZapE
MATVLARYNEWLTAAEIETDAAQRAVAERLDRLQGELETFGAKGNGFARFFASKPHASPRGLYIHGSVGRGKTMLMDLFCDETRFSPKLRTHFHEFMADVHERIGAARAKVEGDPIPQVASDIAAEAKLLCFDELHVTDIADAMILGRLFKGLFAAGTVVVATSNAAPQALYKNGLNRQLFLPFIDMIARHMDVVELAAKKDFRLEKISGTQLYVTPDGPEASAALDLQWDRLTGRHQGKPHTIEFKGRKLVVPLASMGVARFTFEDLCAKPLGTLDYLHIAHAFHTVMIDHIPVLTRDKRNEARRFINLIDTLYDGGVCLIASAAAEPASLYVAGDGVELFERTASRLIEMRSEAYLARHRAGRD